MPLLTGPAIQDFFWPDVHTHVLHYVRSSAEAGLPWVVTADEMGGANFGTLPDADDPDHDDPRRFGLWGSLMAGGAGVEWYFGWQNNGPYSDLSCEDWRTRENMYRQTKIALDFFHEHLPFWRMAPAHEAVVSHGVSALIAPGELYAIYLPHGGGTRFDLGDHPGAKFAYWDEAQMMFGRVLTRAAGRDLLDLLRERVFDPIGLQVADWTPEGDVEGVTLGNGCTGLQLDALNLARFGHLFRNEGRCAGQGAEHTLRRLL